MFYGNPTATSNTDFCHLSLKNVSFRYLKYYLTYSAAPLPKHFTPAFRILFAEVQKRKKRQVLFMNPTFEADSNLSILKSLLHLQQFVHPNI